MNRPYQAEYFYMATSADTQVVQRPRGLVAFLLRGLRSAGYGIVVGLCLAVLRDQGVVPTLIYSVCIALVCWLSIDIGRRLVVRWVNRCHGPLTAGLWPSVPWIVLIVLVGSGVAFLGGTALGDLLTGQHTPSLMFTRYPRATLIDLLVVMIPTIVITFLLYSRSLLAQRQAAAQVAQRQAAESRLRLLESQLEPHMFFNTLANLHVLIGIDPPRAQAMLDQLIAFLRATLSASRSLEHPLEAEFSRTRDYLSLMKVRMEERLQVSFELPTELGELCVPPLLLQPLVENSIRHGLEPSVQGGRIDVRALREGDLLVVEVRDTGVGTGQAPLSRRAGASTGFGLVQVRERLATHYGAGATLTLVPANDVEGGTIATLRLPIS
jgi:signal transduction histidine kinase